MLRRIFFDYVMVVDISNAFPNDFSMNACDQEHIDICDY